jgi:hypothetical protein
MSTLGEMQDDVERQRKALTKVEIELESIQHQVNNRMASGIARKLPALRDEIEWRKQDLRAAEARFLAACKKARI